MRENEEKPLENRHDSVWRPSEADGEDPLGSSDQLIAQEIPAGADQIVNF